MIDGSNCTFFTPCPGGWPQSSAKSEAMPPGADEWNMLINVGIFVVLTLVGLMVNQLLSMLGVKDVDE